MGNDYLIVADDFTGANDTGVEIRRRGIPVRVVFPGGEAAGGGSCVLDTESRSLSEDKAFQRVVSALKGISLENFFRIIKKVDSTLRGNIGAETRALDQCCKPDLIVFAPAFPDLGRTTVNGIQCLNGTPLCQTELARDPKTPVRNDDIRKIMAGAFAGEKIIHIGLEAIRSGVFSPEGGRIFCFDAARNSDLQIMVKTVLAAGRRVLWIGSAALADNLLNTECSVPPSLGVAASLSSITRNQVLFAERQGIPLVKIPLYAILEHEVTPDEIADAAITFLQKESNAILLSSSTYSAEEQRRTEESTRRAGLSPDEMGALIEKTIGQITAMVLGNVKVSGLFLSGGDTAISVLESIGARGSNIITEIALGLPLMRLIGGKFDGLKVITKAGAFGKEDAIFYALRKLREQDIQ